MNLRTKSVVVFSASFACKNKVRLPFKDRKLSFECLHIKITPLLTYSSDWLLVELFCLIVNKLGPIYNISQINDVITYPMVLVWNMIIQQRVACSVTSPCAPFNFPIKYFL